MHALALARCVVLSVAGLVLATSGAPMKWSTDGQPVLYFAIGAVLFGSFGFASTRPIFGDESPLYETVGTVLCLTGAVVGGCVAILLPRLGICLALAATAGIPLILAALELGLDPGVAPDASGETWQSALALAVFAGLVALAAILTEASRIRAEILAVSAIGSWLFVLGLDEAIGAPIWRHVIQASRPHDASVSVEEGALPLVIAWVLLTGLALLGHLASNGLLGGLSRRRGQYSAIASREKKAEPLKKSVGTELSSGASQHSAMLSERSASYNVFDPERLPVRLRRFSTPIFASAEAVGNFFGFQDDSVRNQAEHALMLLANVKSQQEASQRKPDEAFAVNKALRTLHTKIFANYRLWCGALETRPQFAPAPESSRDAGGAALDIVLWLCVWGEAANLRHMPECLCCLYHFAATEWAATPKRDRHGASLYQGHWLDTVVEPLYALVSKSFSKKSDHYDKLNYDDFNEFFWTKKCLDCHYATRLTPTAQTLLEKQRQAAKTRQQADMSNNNAASSSQRQQQEQQLLTGGGSSANGGYGTDDMNTTTTARMEEAAGAAADDGVFALPALADQLKLAPKTHLEVRTWLHIIYSFRRVYEAHVVTFQLLMVLAFSRFLVWDLSYTIQVASCAAVTINVLAICWGVLEVRMLPPAKAETAAAATIAACLVTRFVILAYQTIYLCWAFDALDQLPQNEVRLAEASGGLGVKPEASHEKRMSHDGLALFWWWQHVWLSSLVLACYAVEMMLQLWPRAVTYLHESGGDLWASVMAVIVPSSVLYVGKSVHEPYANARRYHLFWLSLACVKLAFGYRFLVSPMVDPTVEIFDDYLNYPNVPHRVVTSVAQLIGRWSPPMLIYLMDTSIWYSLWSAAVGMLVGVRQKLGIVRDFSAIRDTFLLLPSAFCAKLVAQPRAAVDESTQMLAEETAALAATKKKAKTKTNLAVASAPPPPSGGGAQRAIVTRRLPPLEDGRDAELLRRGHDASSSSRNVSCCGCSGADVRPDPVRTHGGGRSPSSTQELSAIGLGAAGGKAPRLPSFLNLTDALKEPSSSAPPRPGLLELLEHGSARIGAWDSAKQQILPTTTAGGSPGTTTSNNHNHNHNHHRSIGGTTSEDESQWVLFAEAWNEILREMRSSDTLSNEEVDCLRFDSFVGCSKPVYLPIFVTAGAIERATAMASDTAAQYRPLADQAQQLRAVAPLGVESGTAADGAAAGGGGLAIGKRRAVETKMRKLDVTLADAMAEDLIVAEAMDEVRELATRLIVRLLGPVHRDDVVATVSILDRWCREKRGLETTKLEDVHAKVLEPLAQLCGLLLSKQLAQRKAAVREPAPLPPSSEGLGSSSPSSSEMKVPPEQQTPAPQQQPPQAVIDETLVVPPGQAGDVPVPSMMVPPHPELKSTGSFGMAGMKRAQSTSGLVGMATFETAPQTTTTLLMAQQRPKKYSLSSNKYVAGDNALVVEKPDSYRDAVRDKLRTILTAVKGTVNPTSKRARELMDRLTFVVANERGFFWDSAYTSSRLEVLAGDLAAVQRTCRKLKGLITAPVRDTEPRGSEANRRLTFFVNSLLMELPAPPPIEAMNSFSILTPFYSEDVILTKGELLQKNSDGVTTLLYLQTLYKNDWENFVQRRKIKPDGDVAELFSPAHELETRLWSSFRAQTLARTIEGMMHNEAALRLLARLERARALTSGAAPVESTALGVEETIKLKFGYIVSCQVYGRQRKNDDPKAAQIEQLLHRFPGLRVAFIDEVRLNRAGAMAYYSVLVKGGAADDDEGGGGVVEVFRVRLPGNPVIGEGKPENQNHAMIFTRGQCLQTIDMNQDGFFEESLKMRNALEEFHPAKATGYTTGGSTAAAAASLSSSSSSSRTGEDDSAGGDPLTVIVGLREHIFTGSVSSLANYMALQELCFVTLGQRVLSDPLRMRLHYGHPDVFDKVWFATRGGVSKASRGINLSEDIFAGYTGVIRGGGITMKEYVQVGKGRDVGMQQIYKFEAKLSQGNAEQCLSRDVERFAQRLDFPRLLSYYFGGVGHYINSALTVLTIQFSTYLALLLAVYGAESVGGREVVSLGLLQVVLAGFGLINTVPLLATLTVERGLASAAREILQVFISGGPLYFVFHIQTRAHYFIQTLLAGGATYRATGRGFVTRHSHFDDQYRFFASSHLYLAVELAAALLLFGIHSEASQYAGRTWSLWLATLSFFLAPFWFNPLGFSFPHVSEDFRRWSRWITTVGGTANDSWEKWWREETYVYRRLPTQSKFLIGTKAVLYVALARGLCDADVSHPHNIRIFGLHALVLAALGVSLQLADRASRCLSYGLHRLLKMVLGVAAVAVVVAGLASHKSFVRLSIALYYAGAAVNIVGTLVGLDSVKHLQRLHDILVGMAYFAVFLPLSALHVVDVVQTWLLFHNALSQGVVVDDILKQARRSQESSPDAETELKELKRVVEDQQRQLDTLLKAATLQLANQASSSSSSSETTNNNAATNPVLALQQARGFLLGGGGATATATGAGLLPASDGDPTAATSTSSVASEADATQAQKAEPKTTMADPASVSAATTSGGLSRSPSTSALPTQVFDFRSPDAMPPRT